MSNYSSISLLYNSLVLRPFLATSILIMLSLSVINSIAPYNSLSAFKGILVFCFVVLIATISLRSLHYLIYIFVGGAIIQGFGFLVPPTALEQKHFFSYFHILFGTIKIYFTDFFLLVAAFTLPLHLIIHRERIHRKLGSWHILEKFVFAFIFLGIIIATFSIRTNGKSALGEARTVWFAGLFFVAALVFTSRERIISFLRFFVAATIIRTLINTITVLISPEYLSYQRPFGSNNDAAYCAISLITLVIMQEQLLKNVLARRTAQIWLGLFPILITSRSAILCLVITMGCHFIISNSVNIQKLFLWFFIGSASLCVCIFVILNIPALNELFASRFISLFTNLEADPTGNWRLLGWLFAFESIMAHPFVGVGFGGYAERFINGEWLKVSLHSAYLDYLYCMGLVGLLLFVAIITSGISTVVKCYKSFSEGIERRLALSIYLVLCYLALFIALNAEMSYALSGTIMWIFLGMVPFLRKECAAVRQSLQ